VTGSTVSCVHKPRKGKDDAQEPHRSSRTGDHGAHDLGVDVGLWARIGGGATLERHRDPGPGSGGESGRAEASPSVERRPSHRRGLRRSGLSMGGYNYGHTRLVNDKPGWRSARESVDHVWIDPSQSEGRKPREAGGARAPARRIAQLSTARCDQVRGDTTCRCAGVPDADAIYEAAPDWEQNRPFEGYGFGKGEERLALLVDCYLAADGRLRRAHKHLRHVVALATDGALELRTRTAAERTRTTPDPSGPSRRYVPNASGR